jgi:hypothetical protein
VQDMFGRIEKTRFYSQALFNPDVGLSQWIAHRDLFMELLVAHNKIEWLTDQATLGRVEFVNGAWSATALWNHSFAHPLRNKLEE